MDVSENVWSSKG